MNSIIVMRGDDAQPLRTMVNATSQAGAAQVAQSLWQRKAGIISGRSDRRTRSTKKHDDWCSHSEAAR